MRKMFIVPGTIACFFLFSAQTCSDEDSNQKAVLDKLYEEYKFGQIEACTYDGKKVFHAGINAFDAGSQVYDEQGKSIGICNYMTGMVDKACENLKECETIYRCDNHISGEPPVNKYNLGK